MTYGPCISRAMIPFAATGIFVPGPYTSKHPDCFNLLLIASKVLGMVPHATNAQLLFHFRRSTYGSNHLP